MEARIDCDWLPSASTLTPKTNDLLLKGDWFSPIATKEIDFSYIALGLLMILILTVTGPEKKASYNSRCLCVCVWERESVLTGVSQVCVCARLWNLYQDYFTLHPARVWTGIDPLQQTDHHGSG